MGAAGDCKVTDKLKLYNRPSVNLLDRFLRRFGALVAELS